MRTNLLVFVLLCSILTYGQNFEGTIQNYFNQNAESLQIDRDDVADFIIMDQSYSKSMDAYNVYAQQAYQNIPIHNAIGSFAIKQNRVVSFNHTYVSGIQQKVSSVTPLLSAKNALISGLSQLGIEVNSELNSITPLQHYDYFFESEELSSEVMPVKLMYVLDENNSLRLVWDASILTKDENHWWSISIDAGTGNIIRQTDWILTCNFDHSGEGHSHAHSHAALPQDGNMFALTPNDGSQYRVFPLGVESPNHGSRILLTEPADPVASPFGWHDTDGVAGPEFTITRGNNVLASEDRDADNVPGYSPDGGTNLVFDFPLASNVPPSFNEDAAITNLFVWNNYTHDFLFTHGFDEASGNFQQTNYSGLGTGNDFVLADAQDGSGLNNANFGTPPEGFNPRMQMFLWSAPGPAPDLLTINAPNDIAGTYQGVEAIFGPPLTPTPIIADLALIQDDNSTPDSSDPIDGCDVITNGSDLAGKIVVIRRGTCLFIEKIEAAQNNGAVAVIMINNVFGPPTPMGGDDASINIPSIMISLADGATILTKLQNNETINASLSNAFGPYRIDGDYDSGIVAHEYGHGISTRLTAGAQQVNCLFNDEQMGEGWSDWVGLMMTINPGDTPEQPRGIGTFAVNQPTNGVGIRPAPYSTDFSVNSATYGLTNNAGISRPHGIGFVWATMLWDLTWELIDQYGFDPDLINGNGGNNLATQLVIDGMKLQSCQPGFIDGRDAILQADQIANNGANACYIWKVFANRGLGFSASQGASTDRFDQVEAFDLPPTITLPCQPLSTQEFAENNLKIYPNPADDIVNIDAIAGSIGKANLKIYDLNGKQVFNAPYDFNILQQVDVTALNRGLYILKIENTSVNISKKLLID